MCKSGQPPRNYLGLAISKGNIYENVQTKSLPKYFFTNMFVKVCNNMIWKVEIQLQC